MKKYLGIPLKIIIGLAVVFAGYFAGLGVYYYVQQWYFGYAINAVEKQYVEQFAADTAGGATPEETWSMFIAALEAGDIDLASQYFYLETREEEGDSLQYHVDAGTLQDFVAELKDDYAKSERKPGITDTQIDFVYKVQRDERTIEFNDGTEQTLPSGEYESRIEFVKNEISNVWKIYRL